MSSLVLIFLIFGLLQVGSHVQVESSSSPRGSQQVEIPDGYDPDVENLFQYKGKNTYIELNPQKSYRLLAVLAKTGYGVNKFGLRSDKSIKTLLEVSNIDPEKCNSSTMASLVNLRDQHVVYRSLHRYIAHYLTHQVDACRKPFSKQLYKQLSNVIDEKVQAFDKIVKLREIIKKLERDETIEQAKVDDHQGAVASEEKYSRLALDALLTNIPQETFEHGLALYLTGAGFVLKREKHDQKRITKFIQNEFREAIETFNSYLKELMSLYGELKLAAPIGLQAYDDMSKFMMVNIQLVNLLSKGQFTTENIAKWMPEREKPKSLLSKLCVGQSSVKE